MGRPKNLPLLEKLIKEFSDKGKKNKFSYLDSPSFAYYFSGIDSEYDTYHQCQNGSDCCRDDYCRCGTIENIRNITVDISALISGLVGNSKEILNAYCVDRLIRASDLKDPSNWELNVERGYYGEETHGHSPNQLIIDNLISDFKLMLNMSDANKVKLCLKNEYGHVLPSLEKLTNAEICLVKTDDIELFNDHYVRKINKKFVDQYDDYEFPRAVCTLAGSKYRVIDGYHRMSSALNKNLKEVSIIVLS